MTILVLFWLQFIHILFNISFYFYSDNMASSVEKELAKHLECGICLQTFKEPKVLDCHHSYCKKCLERLVITTVHVGRHEHEISCPECRRKTKVRKNNNLL